MLRIYVILSLILAVSAFLPHMFDIQPSTQKPNAVPIICKPRLKLRDMQVSNCKNSMKKLVYEATFENDHIVFRPRRRRLKRSCWKKLQILWRRFCEKNACKRQSSSSRVL